MSSVPETVDGSLASIITCLYSSCHRVREVALESLENNDKKVCPCSYIVGCVQRHCY